MRSVEIIIRYPKSLSDRNKVYFLAYGIEEEGIPFKLMESDASSAHDNANQAAMDSGLDIGIGIGSDWQIVTRHSRFQEGIYLFDIKAHSGIDMKAYGANAARLMKGVPFKEIVGG